MAYPCFTCGTTEVSLRNTNCKGCRDKAGVLPRGTGEAAKRARIRGRPPTPEKQLRRLQRTAEDMQDRLTSMLEADPDVTPAMVQLWDALQRGLVNVLREYRMWEEGNAERADNASDEEKQERLLEFFSRQEPRQQAVMIAAMQALCTGVPT